MTIKEKVFKIITDRCFISDNKAAEIECNLYYKSAVDFLVETETTCDIENVGTDQPSWGKTRVNKYRVTLKNKRHSYSFDFWDSIANTEAKKSLKFNFYSVLASLDPYINESFDNFCAEFGYEFKNESEYIKAKDTHLKCIDQVKNLKKLFTSDQLERLGDIQ